MRFCWILRNFAKFPPFARFFAQTMRRHGGKPMPRQGCAAGALYAGRLPLDNAKDPATATAAGSCFAKMMKKSVSFDNQTIIDCFWLFL
jgi:hypothetical protein